MSCSDLHQSFTDVLVIYYDRPYVVMGRPLYFTPVVSLFFSRLFSVVVDCMSTIFPHDVVLMRIYNASLKMCCTRLAENTGRKNSQNSPSSHRRTICRTIFSQLRHVFTIQIYLLHMFSPYGEFRHTSGCDRLAGFGHPSKFQRVFSSCLC